VRGLGRDLSFVEHCDGQVSSRRGMDHVLWSATESIEKGIQGVSSVCRYAEVRYHFGLFVWTF